MQRSANCCGGSTRSGRSAALGAHAGSSWKNSTGRRSRPLPVEPYVFAEWRLRRVGIDYHVDVNDHYYSVPHGFARAEVEVRLTTRTVEIFVKGERIAAHVRSSGNHKHSTVPEHMPSSHRRYADWTIDRIRQEAASIGPATAALCELLLERRPHPEQGFRACRGILRLVRAFGVERL